MPDNDDAKPPPKIDTTRRFSRRNLLRRLGGQKEDRPGASALGFDTLARQADRLVREQQYEQALLLYRRMIEREPSHREAWRYKGWCLLKLGRPVEAREALEKLLNSNPDDGHALLYTGISHALENNIEAALEVWRRYRDYSRVLIVREINLILFEADQEEPLEGEALARRIEDAIRRQELA